MEDFWLSILQSVSWDKPLEVMVSLQSISSRVTARVHVGYILEREFVMSNL